jgi:hypothetical protein
LSLVFFVQVLDQVHWEYVHLVKLNLLMSIAFAHWSQCLISQLLVKIVCFFQTIPRYANIDSSSDHDIVYFCLLSLYASGLDDCLYWDKLRWNDITLANLLQWLEWGYLTSLVDIWIECQPTSWPSFSIASGDVTETQDVDVSIIVCLNFREDGHLHSTTGAVDIGSWQLITTIHDEGDDLTLCVWHS